MARLPDYAFALPDRVTDADLRDLHDHIVASMQEEAAGYQLNTIQQLLIERIAYNYIILRFRERRPMGDADGHAHERNQKELNTFWLEMTAVFTKTLGQASHSAAARGAVIKEVAEVVARVLEQRVPDPSRRQAIGAAMIAELEALEQQEQL